VMQYGHKGPEAQRSCRLFIGTSDCHSVCLHGTAFGQQGSLLFAFKVNYHQCGDHTALLSEGHTPPSVMPIYSPRGLNIRRKRQLLRGCTAPAPACTSQ